MAGLQNPILGAVLQFAVASGLFVQVLHDGELHWVTVPPPHVDAVVIIYDSLNRSANMHCKMQIASLLSTTHSTIRCVVDTSDRVGSLAVGSTPLQQRHLCVMRNSPVASTIRLQCVDTCEPALNVVS